VKDDGQVNTNLLMGKPLLIAIGGNSLIRAGQSGSVKEQIENANTTCRSIARLVAQGRKIVITHGNGPQVGAQLIRSEMASQQVYQLPLDSCDASTQGELGYVLQNAMRTALHAVGIKIPVITILTQVVVDERDPAFADPSKPVGPFYSKEVAEKKKNELGWKIIEDAARGYRRLVPSPYPLEIVELEAIKYCLSQGFIVIAVGGGGIPVVEKDGVYHGVEAVVDKDRASSLLANKLNLETFIISTDTDKVYLNFKKPNQLALDNISLAQAKKYMNENHFLSGSMGPKVEAAIDFLSKGGNHVIITSPELIYEAQLNRKTGTHIFSTEKEANHET
jgi:carbamate kinase